MSSTPSPHPKLQLSLSLFSLPNQPQEPPGMLTPPLQPPSSIPFLWEEAPGKPRLSSSPPHHPLSPTRSHPTAARSLELPPRLLLETKMSDTSTASPSTVLDGPYVRRSMSHSTVFARERFDDGGVRVHRKESRGSGYFGGVGRKFGSMRHTRVWESSSVASPCPSSMSCCDAEAEVEKRMGVKITRVRRKGSFFGFSDSRRPSRVLASLYGTFKQALPWRTRKIKKDGLFI